MSDVVERLNALAVQPHRAWLSNLLLDAVAERERQA